jgi:glycosyltransferase involved in cell wall biosynthesis
MLSADYTQVGGERQSVEAEVQGLQNAGVDVRHATVANGEVVEAGAFRSARIMLSTKAPGSLTSLIEAHDPELIHCQNLFPFLGAKAINAINDTGRPWVRTLRNYRLRCLSANLWLDGAPCRRCDSAQTAFSGVLNGCYRSSKVASIGALAYSRQESRANRQHAPIAYIAISKFVRDIMRGSLEPAVPVHVKPNSVTPRLVPTQSSPRDGVVFAGRLTQEKGVHVVLELARRLPHRRFTVIGDGPHGAAVRDAATELRNLQAVRHLSPAAVLAAMGAAQLAIVPSQWDEPFGRVAVEALSVGTPPLVSQRGGLAEIVSAVSDDLLVSNASDPSAWARAVESLLADSERRKRLSALSLARYSSTYDLTATTQSLLEIYRQSIDAAQRMGDGRYRTPGAMPTGES